MIVAGSDFEQTWIPRIGPEGAERLAYFRRVTLICGPSLLVFSGAASFAFAGDGLDKGIGVVLVVCAAVTLLAFARAQQQLAVALSRWFGVKLKAGNLPPMSPRRFDAWCKKRELRRQD